LRNAKSWSWPVRERRSVITAEAGRYGLITMCIGGGQGIAAIYERL
jgi:acetyl-CoA acetyltransferase